MQYLRMRRATVTVTVLCAAMVAGPMLGAVGAAWAEQAEDGGTPPINLEIKGGEIAEVLRMLGRAADVDIVVNEGVSGTVSSLNLRGKSIDEALYLIAQTHGCQVRKLDATTYVVSPSGASEPLTGAPLNPYGATLLGERPVSPDLPAMSVVAPEVPTMSAWQIEGSSPVLQEAERGEWIWDEIKLKYADPAVVARTFGGAVTGGGTVPPRARHYEQELLPFAGDLSLPGASFVGQWPQYGRNPGGGLGGSLGQYGGGSSRYGGSYGGSQYGGGGYGGSGYGGQYGGGQYGGGQYGGGQYGGQYGGYSMSLPEGMEPPLAILAQNVLLVRGTQEAIDKFREILAIFDKPTRQVEIECRFVEVQTSKDKAFGIDWFVANGAAEVFNLGFAPGTGINVVKFRRGRFEAELRTLLSDHRAELVNAPRVTAQNNMQASVNFSTEIPYFYATTTYDEFGNREVNFEIESIEVTQSLFVTPRILGDDSVVLMLEPQIDDQSGTVVSPDGTVLPIVSTQSAYSQVRVHDGETIVMGGFSRVNDDIHVRKTPLLSSLPIIGDLFRSRTVNKRRSELLIFVTTRITRDIPPQ